MTIVYLSSLFVFNLFTASQEEMLQIRGKYEWLIFMYDIMYEWFMYCIHFTNPKKKNPWKPTIYQARKIASKCVHRLKIIQMVSSNGKEYWEIHSLQNRRFRYHASWNVKGFHQNDLLNHNSRCGEERWKLSITINSSPNPFFRNINHFKISEKLGESP